MYKGDKFLLGMVGLLLLLPIIFSIFSHESFRYPCQDPANWDKDICKMPLCDVTRTCPEHIFKGQRDPRLGPATDANSPPKTVPAPAISQGANCGK